jgi:citrate synthase
VHPIDPIIACALGIDVDRVSAELAYQSVSEWSSLQHVALMLELEQHLAVTIDDDQLVELRSVAAIRTFSDSLDGAGGAAASVTGDDGSDDRAPEIHRGLEDVYIDRSTITHIDGEHGVLEYRGYSIHDLVRRSCFEETSWLLLHGDLPGEAELTAFRAALDAARAVPEPIAGLLATLATAHPMEALRTAVSALGALETPRGDETAEQALDAALRLIARVPTLVATHHAARTGHAIATPRNGASHGEHLLHSILGTPPSALAARVVDQELIVHADHGSNASTFAARVATGCGSNMHAAISAAIATFSGPLHGGAAERVTDVLDDVDGPSDVAGYVRDRLARNQPVMGFGHRVYRTDDPRVRHLRAAARALSDERGDTRGLEIVEAVIAAMKPYARHGIEPNVDLYAGLVYRLLGLPDDLAVPMFVAGRIAGWTAQVLEQRSNNVLIRPLLQYVGPRERTFPDGELAA